MWGDTRADKAKAFIGKGYPDGEQQGKETQENFSATWLTVSSFMVMRLISGFLWLTILTQGPFWYCAHNSANKDSSEKDSERLVGHKDWCLLSPLDPSRILLVGGSLFVPHSLQGPPVLR